jgi:hypothetical protein
MILLAVALSTFHYNYLSLILIVISCPLLHIIDELYPREIMLMLGLELLLYFSQTFEFGLHEQDLTFGIIEFVTHTINLLLTFIVLDVGKGFVGSFPSIDSLLLDYWPELLIIEVATHLLLSAFHDNKIIDDFKVNHKSLSTQINDKIISISKSETVGLEFKLHAVPLVCSQ